MGRNEWGRKGRVVGKNAQTLAETNVRTGRQSPTSCNELEANIEKESGMAGSGLLAGKGPFRTEYQKLPLGRCYLRHSRKGQLGINRSIRAKSRKAWLLSLAEEGMTGS